MRQRVHIGLPLPALAAGWTTVAVGIADGFRDTGLDPVLYLPRAIAPLPPGLAAVQPSPVPLPGRVAGHPRVAAWLRARSERRLVAAVRKAGPGALVWLWPEVSTGTIRALRAADAVIVREMINTRRSTAKRILDEESARLGLPQRAITDALVAEEDADLALVDHVVSPSECVDESMLARGWPEERIIRSTFAWDAAEFADRPPAALDGPGPRALFLGTVGVRKGIHLALAAWDAAATGGQFIVVGNVDPEAEALVAPYRGRPDIRWLPFQRDLGALYRAADFMFFPSLEEGAPLVCYQAAGCGLPILTSPMGRGRVIADGTTGLVVDPHDHGALVAALRRMSGDAALRARLAAAARDAAAGLTWRNVARERADAILARLG